MVLVVGDKLAMDEVAEHVQSKWCPQNGFQIEDCRSNYFKVIFKDEQDHKKSMLEEWTWIKTNIAIIQSGASASDNMTKVYKEEYFQDEIVAWIASTLGTLPN